MPAVQRLAAELVGGVELTPLQRVALARRMHASAEETLQEAVAAARSAGTTWAQLGEVLGTSRQAAFQRFGRPVDPRTGAAMTVRIGDAGARALALFAALAEHRWAQACLDFNERVAAHLDAESLAAVWAQTAGLVGRFEGLGEPTVYQAGDYTIADVPLRFEAGDRLGRVAFDVDSRVAGLFIRPADHQ